MNIDLIHQLASKEKIAFKKHTLLRMHQREIASTEIQEVLKNGLVIEEYEGDKPLPSCLLLGYTSNQRPLHVVVALDEEEELLWVITVYEPSEGIWEKGLKKRRHL